MSEINYDIIDQYLAGELSGDALLAFEKEMQANPELATEVALYKTIEDEMKLHQQEQGKLTTTLNALTEKHFKLNESGARIITPRFWYLAAAAAAAVILLFIFNPFAKKPFDHEQLFAYYNHDPQKLSEAQRGKNEDTLLIKAAMLYNKKDYAGALPLLRNLIAAKPDETEFVLATGICCLQTRNYDEANDIFEKIQKGNSVYKNQAAWYNALLLLKQNKITDCRKLLENIPQGSDNYKDAQELIRKIDNK